MHTLSARQLHLCICISVAHELCSLTLILQLLRLLAHSSCTQDPEHLLDLAGTVTLAQAESFIVMGTAGMYSEELATCFASSSPALAQFGSVS